MWSTAAINASGLRDGTGQAKYLFWYSVQQSASVQAQAPLNMPSFTAVHYILPKQYNTYLGRRRNRHRFKRKRMSPTADIQSVTFDV
jgi:hypothetical protein